MSIRRYIEAARRTRAKNLDAIDVACRTLVVRRNQEANVLRESRRVSMEAERFEAVLTRLQVGGGGGGGRVYLQSFMP